MLAQQYAEAIYLATQNKNEAELDAVVNNIRALLESRGHGALLPAIVRELEKLITRRNKSNESVVRVARNSDTEVFRERIAADLHTLEGTDIPQQTVVDETVIGGYEVRTHGVRLDRTYKRALLNLYNNLITN